MANPTNPKGRSEGADEKKGEPSRYATPESIVKHFWEINTRYGQAMQEGQLIAQKRWEQAQRNYWTGLASLTEDTQKRYREAHVNHVQAVQEAFGQQDAQTRCTESYRDYISTLQGLREEVQKGLTEKYRNWTDELQRARKEILQFKREACRTYLRSQQEAWGSLDVNAAVGGDQPE